MVCQKAHCLTLQTGQVEVGSKCGPDGNYHSCHVYKGIHFHTNQNEPPSGKYRIALQQSQNHFYTTWREPKQHPEKLQN